MPKFMDLTGQKFGELLVVEMLRGYKDKHTYCKCLGDDGEEYIIRQDALRSGATKYIKGACSAGKINDITGQRFGRLVALYPTDERAANNGIIWMCRCDCGELTKSTSNNLIRGHTTSCGCHKQSNLERYVTKYLKSKGIIFENEKTFDDLWNPAHTMHLYFDFYFPDKRMVIELDGEQHERPVKIFGGEMRFEYQKILDATKDEYCSSHGITMIRIPYARYTRTEEVIQIINNVICP